MALGCTALAGVMLYQHPNWIEEAVDNVTGHVPTLAPGPEITATLPTIRQSLGARLVMVLGTDPGRNEQWLIGYDVDPLYSGVLQPLVDTRWRTVSPMFTGDQNEMLVRILGGEILCTTLEGHGVPVVQLLDLTMVCAAGIPPGPQALLGYIAAGFGTPVNRAELTRVRTILRKYGEDWAR